MRAFCPICVVLDYLVQCNMGNFDMVNIHVLLIFITVT